MWPRARQARPLGRRAFAALLGRGLVAAAIAGLPYAVARQLSPQSFANRDRPEKRLLRYDYDHPLRPPGALAEQAFLGACIQCGNCGQACPVKAIRFFGNGGRGLAQTPYIQPEYRGCILCEKCPEVCPSGALRPVPPEEVRMGRAFVDRNSCYPWVDRGICGACVSACPIGASAIRFDFADFYRPVVEAGCVGCGVCVEVCPHPAKAVRVVPRIEKELA